jgi:hypothetical protein
VRDAHTEAERAHAARIGDLVRDGAGDQAHAGVVRRVEVLELSHVVAAARPRDAGEVGLVVQPEVMERAQQAAFERLPQAQLDRNAPIEPVQHALAVSAFRCGGQAHEVLRAEVIQEPFVGGCRGVVELVDDDDVERIRLETRQLQLRQRLHGREHVPPLPRPISVHVQLAKRSLAQHLPEGAEALAQQLLPVRHEQQAQVSELVPQPPVIERGDDGLAGARGSDDEGAEPMVALALHREPLENLALVRKRDDVDGGELKRIGRGRRRHGDVEPLRVPCGVVGFEVRFLPVAVERRLELLEDVGRRHLRQPHVPLEAVHQRPLRQVR